MKSLNGKFIVIDGGEGCGKSTQMTLLRDKLTQAGQDVLTARDPGATRVGEMIRAVLLDPKNTDIAMRCEMLLYMAARAELMRDLILPGLERGACVLCDRFVSSTMAYQLGGDDLTLQEIHAVADVAIKNRWPDLTILLDMPPEKSHARLNRSRDRIERRSAQYHQRVRENYLAQAARDPRTVKIVSADRDAQLVHQEIVHLVEAMA